MTKTVTWRKGFLVPTWFIQLLGSLILLAAAGYAMSIAGEVGQNENSLVQTNTDQPSSAHVVGLVQDAAGICIALTVTVLLLSIAEIIGLAVNHLHPWWFLASACIKTCIWGLYFIATIISAVNGSSLGFALAFGVILFATTISQLVYVSIMVHRHRKSKRQGRPRGIAKRSSTRGAPKDYDNLRADLIAESVYSRSPSFSSGRPPMQPLPTQEYGDARNSYQMV